MGREVLVNALLVVLAGLVAVATAVRSTWSPCGQSMLSTMTPIAERARDHRFWVTAAWFMVGATVGGLTPPFGYVLFALKSAAPDVPLQVIYRASWPFVWIIVAGLVLFAVFPDLITFLPNLTSSR